MKDGKPEVLIIGEAHPGSLYYSLFKHKIKKIEFGKRAEKISTVDTETARPDLKSHIRFCNFFQKLGIPLSIIKAEIKAIKDFGAQRILYEFPNTKRNIKILAQLSKTRNLERFQKAFSLSCILMEKAIIKETVKLYNRNNIGRYYCPYCRKKYKASGFCKGCMIHLKDSILDIPPPPLYVPKILSFIMGSTGIYDVKFIDDFDTFRKIDAYCSIPDLTIPRNLDEQREKTMVENAKKEIIDKTVIICGADHVAAMKQALKDIAYLHEPQYFKANMPY